MRKRIDVLLTEKGLVRSRTQAAELITLGNVLVDGVVIKKPSTTISLESRIEIKNKPQYVGRGGQKLAHALETFNVDVRGRTALDIGASTGGFTDCLLQHGACKVYAVDVGHDQLVPEIKNDERVVSMEGVDIRSVPLPEKTDLAVVDVSFISVKNIFPVLVNHLKNEGEAIVLIKPQFEVGKGKLGKGGVVKDEKLRETVVREVIETAQGVNLSLVATADSPILGGSGNKEYLAYFKKNY